MGGEKSSRPVDHRGHDRVCPSTGPRSRVSVRGCTRQGRSNALPQRVWAQAEQHSCHCARLCHGPAVRALRGTSSAPAFASGQLCVRQRSTAPTHHARRGQRSRQQVRSGSAFHGLPVGLRGRSCHTGPAAQQPSGCSAKPAALGTTTPAGATLAQDDDVRIDPDGMAALAQARAEAPHPAQLVGFRGRDWPRQNAPSYIAREVSPGLHPVVLTIALAGHKAVCAAFFKYAPFVDDLVAHAKPLWNGEEGDGARRVVQLCPQRCGCRCHPSPSFPPPCWTD